jgi:hypothetical protein
MHRVFPWLIQIIRNDFGMSQEGHQREKRKKEEGKMSRGDVDEDEDEDEDEDFFFDHNSDVLHDLIQSLTLSIY